VIFSHGTYGAWGALLAKSRFGGNLPVVAAAASNDKKATEEEELLLKAELKNWTFIREDEWR